ncbi:hypothetical protein CD798_02930 [Bacillaceae bacterium SAOS 7]|nr:hypothetical protein CD798_02930 [Bacillaceae bacterium SAOS 7]
MSSFIKRISKNNRRSPIQFIFPTAAYLVYGEVGPKQVLDQLDDPAILKMMDKIEVNIDQTLNQTFPKKALSKVEIITKDKKVYHSPVTQARGDYDFPLTAPEKKEKFLHLTVPHLGTQQAQQLLELIYHIESLSDISELTDALSIEEANC